MHAPQYSEKWEKSSLQIYHGQRLSYLIFAKKDISSRMRGYVFQIRGSAIPSYIIIFPAMEIGSIDLNKYQKNDYFEAYIHLRDEKYAKKHVRTVSARVRDIMEGMLYFINKYSLDIGLVLDPEKVLDYIREKHPHDYEEI